MRGKVNYGISGNYIINGNRNNAVISGDNINKGDFVYAHMENGNVFKINVTPYGNPRTCGGAFKVSDTEILVISSNKYYVYDIETKELLNSGQGLYNYSDGWFRLDDEHFLLLATTGFNSNQVGANIYVYEYNADTRKLTLSWSKTGTDGAFLGYGTYYGLVSAYVKDCVLKIAISIYNSTSTNVVNQEYIYCRTIKIDIEGREVKPITTASLNFTQVTGVTCNQGKNVGGVTHAIHFNNKFFCTSYDRANGIIKRSKIFVTSDDFVEKEINETSYCIVLPVFVSRDKFIVWKINAQGAVTSYDVANERASSIKPSRNINVSTANQTDGSLNDYPPTVGVNTLIEGELYVVHYSVSNGNVYRCLIGEDFITEDLIYDAGIRGCMGYDLIDEYNHNLVYFSQESKEKTSDSSFTPLARLQMIANNKIVDEKPKDYYVSQAKNAQYINGVANASGSDGDAIQIITSDFVG